MSQFDLRTHRMRADLRRLESRDAAHQRHDESASVGDDRGHHRYRVAAIVPCHNEEAAVGDVVRTLLRSVPSIQVYVYDNRSTDATAEIARKAGAIVRYEHRKGKGNVIRRAFADIEADIYLLIDGDDTYDARMAPELIEALIAGPYDHVLGLRHPTDPTAYRPNHELGNRVLNLIVGKIFGDDVGDMLSGYRAFSRRFVKSFPAVSKEFEIETELTVHCLALRVPATAIPIGFKDRPEGSESKLRTYRDGGKILGLIVNLARHERPIAFYGVLGAIAVLCSALVTVPVILEYTATGAVPRLPTLIFTVGLATISVIALTCGLVLDGMRKSRHEGSRLVYLSLPPVSAPVGAASLSLTDERDVHSVDLA